MHEPRAGSPFFAAPAQALSPCSRTPPPRRAAFRPPCAVGKSPFSRRGVQEKLQIEEPFATLSTLSGHLEMARFREFWAAREAAAAAVGDVPVRLEGG